MEVEAAVKVGAKERLSKSCFFVAGADDADVDAQDDPMGFYPTEDWESSESVHARSKAYQETWNRIRMNIHSQVAQMNEQVYGKISQFVKNAHATDLLASRVDRPEVPTALLCTGINVPDHAMIFEQLASTLQTEAGARVARIRSDEANTAAALVKAAATQLLAAIDHDAPARVSSFKPIKIRYDQNDSDRRPLVVVLEDFEGFSSRALEDFITACSHYVSSLPLVLLFGVATSFDTVHQLLPRPVHAAIATRRFTLQSARLVLQRIVNSVLMSPSEVFGLTVRPCQFILDQFLRHNMSVAALTSGLQDAVLDHYLSTPLSFLCSERPDVSALSAEHCEHLRGLPSMRSHVEKLVQGTKADAEKVISLLTDDSYLRDYTMGALKSLRAHRARMMPVLMCFHAAVRECNPTSLFGKHPHDIYIAVMRQNILSTPEYQEVLDSLWKSESRCLRRIMEQSLAHLASATSAGAREEMDDLRSVQAQLSAMLDRLVDLIESGQERAEDIDTSLLGPRAEEQTPETKTTEEVPAEKSSATTPADGGAGYKGEGKGQTGGQGHSEERRHGSKRRRDAGETDRAETPSKRRVSFAPSLLKTPPQPASAKATEATPIHEEGENEGEGEGGVAWKAGEPLVQMVTRTKMLATPRVATDATTKIDTSHWSLSKKRRVGLLRSAGLESSLLPAALRIRTKYQALREEVCALMATLFRRCLAPPTTLPLHEVLYCQSAAEMKAHLIGRPRMALQMALAHPHVCIDDPELEALDVDKISPLLPDVCIAYKLHLECPRLINLYDWCQAFCAIVEPDLDLADDKTHKLNRKGKKSKQAVEGAETRRKQVMARFIASVTQLEFLGFIRPTKRKTDHVERLTWGSV